MTDSIRIAIEAADVDALRAQVAADNALADADVLWGGDQDVLLPPLHLVCDAVFRRLATQEQALAMADVLLESGVDPDRSYAKSGDSFLITAASLGAEKVGTRLVEVGADVTRRGLFDATALHWAAFMGLDALALALVKRGSDLELADAQYDCTPLQWGLHAWTDGTNGYRDGLPRVARVLVEHGARVPSDALGELTKDTDAVMRESLSSPR
jgi:hypothetical protein